MVFNVRICQQKYIYVISLHYFTFFLLIEQHPHPKVTISLTEGDGKLFTSISMNISVSYGLPMSTTFILKYAIVKTASEQSDVASVQLTAGEKNIILSIRGDLMLSSLLVPTQLLLQLLLRIPDYKPSLNNTCC